jgi:predicted phosphodiesterase
MRVLICGDIHGNLIALETMLKHEHDGYDLFISHGDVVNYGPWSNECVDLLRNLDVKINLKGNHEENYLNGFYEGKNEIANTFFNFCFPQFDRFDSIRKFGDTYNLGKFVIQHTLDNKYIYPDSDIESIMSDKTKNYIIGHSHHQFSYKSNNGLLLYNTGSVGQNRKYINVINYLIYDDQTNFLEMKELTYDVKMLLNEMKAKKYPSLCIAYYESKLIK